MNRLAAWCYDRRWRVVALWVLAIVAFSTLNGVAGGKYSNNFSLPGSEAQRAFDLLEDTFPAQSGDNAQVAFKAAAGVRDPAVKAKMEAVFAEIAKVPHVVGVQSPYSTEGANQISDDGTIAFATVQFDALGGDIPLETVERVVEIAEAARAPGLQVELGGYVIQAAQQEEPGAAEIVGILAAILILLITFGSLLAMALPIVTALFGIGIGLALVGLITNVFDVPVFAPQLAGMIGIGVGIDYALFIVTRYRSSLHAGVEPRTAAVHALATSGRAVLIAGLTVVISLLGMFLMGFKFVQGLAVGAVATVLVTMLASVTLVPALFGFVGRNIDKLRLPGLHRHESDHRESAWFRWSRLIQRRPAIFALVGLVALVALSVPVFSIRLGSADTGNDPPRLTTRQAYDMLADGFGPGFNGPFVIAAELPSRSEATVVQRLADRLRTTEGVAEVGPVIQSPTGNTAIISVYPEYAPQDERTDQLVRRLRGSVVPEVTRGTGVRAYVGGVTAFSTDFAQQIANRLPLLIGAVIALSFLLLMVVFRSVLVPLKAAVMNLLSIGAAYGVIVAIFQWGWGKDLLGIEPGPIEAWAPMMLFAILFGLSMDYEVFLLSRIREEYVRSRDNAVAVADGLATTARVITAAAAIMITVFLSFVFGFDQRQIQLFGLGLAVAIFVDATLVRMILVPATMELLGDANWWLPRWLDRLLPHVSAEGAASDLPLTADEEVAPAH